MENISIEQAEKALKEQCAAWVDKELLTGIEFPIHYWKGGHYKQLFSMMTFKGFALPYMLFSVLPIILLAAIKSQEWTLIGILIGIVVAYTLLERGIHRRTGIKILLSGEALTFVWGRKKTVIPWKNVKKITYITEVAGTGVEQRDGYCVPSSGITYEIMVQTDCKFYNFYDLYEDSWNFDERGRPNLPSMQLHIAYVLMSTARDKAKMIGENE